MKIRTSVKATFSKAKPKKMSNQPRAARLDMVVLS